MKISTSIYLILALNVSLASNTQAATDYNSSRSNKSLGVNLNLNGGGLVPVIKEKLPNDRQNKTQYGGNASVKQGTGDDLILRKRPGRSNFTPTPNCLMAKKGEKHQPKPNCPDNK